MKETSTRADFERIKGETIRGLLSVKGRLRQDQRSLLKAVEQAISEVQRLEYDPQTLQIVPTGAPFAELNDMLGLRFFVDSRIRPLLQRHFPPDHEFHKVRREDNRGLLDDLAQEVRRMKEVLLPVSLEELEEAAAQGSDTAKTQLALYLMTGFLVPRDSARAHALLLEAVESGHCEAMYCLGRYFEIGAGGKIDLPRAMEWYRKAATSGHKDARDALARLTAP